jgi:hypothetical protein
LTGDMRSASPRAYDEAGLRHVVPPVTSATVSPEAAAYETDAKCELPAVSNTPEVREVREVRLAHPTPRQAAASSKYAEPRAGDSSAQELDPACYPMEAVAQIAATQVEPGWRHSLLWAVRQIPAVARSTKITRISCCCCSGGPCSNHNRRRRWLLADHSSGHPCCCIASSADRR